MDNIIYKTVVSVDSGTTTYSIKYIILPKSNTHYFLKIVNGERCDIVIANVAIDLFFRQVYLWNRWQRRLDTRKM